MVRKLLAGFCNNISSLDMKLPLFGGHLTHRKLENCRPIDLKERASEILIVLDTD
jgi:hypothetical protein